MCKSDFVSSRFQKAGDKCFVFTPFERGCIHYYNSEMGRAERPCPSTNALSELGFYAGISQRFQPGERQGDPERRRPGEQPALLR